MGPITDQGLITMKYKCGDCGRVMGEKYQPHKCIHGYQKGSWKNDWEEIRESEVFANQLMKLHATNRIYIPKVDENIEEGDRVSLNMTNNSYEATVIEINEEKGETVIEMEDTIPWRT